MMIQPSVCQWHRICTIDDIPVQGSRVVQRAGQDDIAVFRTANDEIFAVVDRCPHKGGPLSAGLVHGRSVACPLHNWVIQLDDGRAQAPDEGCALKVPVKVSDGDIYLGLD